MCDCCCCALVYVEQSVIESAYFTGGGGESEGEVRTSRLFTSWFFFSHGWAPDEKITAHAEFIAIPFCEVVHGSQRTAPTDNSPTLHSATPENVFPSLQLHPAAVCRRQDVRHLIGTCAHAHRFYLEGIAREQKNPPPPP